MQTEKFLYLKTCNLLLDGKLEDAKTYATFLRNDMERGKLTYSSFLNSKHAKQAPNLISAILTGNITEKKEEAYRFEAIKGNVSAKAKDEKELKDIIFRNLDVLCKAWGAELKFIGEEQPTDDGNVDLLFKNEKENIIIPVELKDEDADFDVVSQILKYTKYFKKLYLWNLYDWVSPAVIALGYDKYSINQLQMENVRTFVYAKGNTFLISEFPDIMNKEKTYHAVTNNMFELR